MRNIFGIKKNTSNIKEYEETRRNILIYLFTIVFLSYLLIYSILDIFIINSPTVGFFLAICFVAGMINLIAFKKGLIGQGIAGTIIIIFTFLIFTFLFYIGGIENSGIFWSLLFPTMSFFLKGKKKGLILSLLLLAILNYIHFIINSSSAYKNKYIIVFFSVYLIITLFSFIYEYSLNQYLKIIKEKIDYILNSKKELEESEQKLKRLNYIKDKMITVISHDLKGSIGSIKSFLDKKIENNNDEELILIQKALNSSYDILENFIVWTNIQPSSFEYSPSYFSINNLTERVITSLSLQYQAKSIQLIKDLSETNPIVKGDKNMIEVVIRNIISNAIKFTPFNGQIIVKTEENHKKVCVSIKDSGIGIKKETIERLKENKTINPTIGSNGEKGSGLGLWICKGFLEKNESNLEIETSEKGSTFSFHLIKV